MDLKDRTAVVTGGAHGIGAALCDALAAAGSRVVCADLDLDAAQSVARRIGGHAMAVDVREDVQIARLIETTESEIGPIDLFVSNAGILTLGGVEVPDAEWQKIWEINVMAHVRAARLLVPRMAARGGGYLLNTASAAGLLNQVGAAPYGVTKHAAVGLAEWLAMSHADDGIKVSVLCPQAVRTEMTRGHEAGVASIDGMLEPDEVAQACIDAIRDETFLILPHAKVRDYIRFKAADYDRWIGGMTKLHRSFSTT